MNYENIKTSDPQIILLLNLTDQIKLKKSNKYVALSNVGNYCRWENITNLKYQLQHGMKSLENLIDDTARRTIFSFSKCFEKIITPKNVALEYDISCIIRKNDISSPRKYDIIL